MAGLTSAWRRNLAGCLAVAAGVALFSVGLPAIEDAIPDETVPTNEPLPFANNVTVLPPPGATVEADETSPTQGVITMAVDGVRYRIRAQPFGGSLQQLAVQVRDQITDSAGVQGVSPDQPITSSQGVPGLQATFVGENRTGWYTVLLAAGTGVTAVVDGNDASVTRHRADIDASIRTITIEGAT